MNTKTITTIGIVGNGFVGGTCYQAFEQLDKTAYKVRIFDTNPLKCKDNAIDTFISDFVFIAVPTPTDFDECKCDISMVENTIKEIRQHRQDNLIIIKSTVPPGTTEKLAKIYKNICFNPEFLREVAPYEDFISLPYQIIGTTTYTELTLINDLCALFRTLVKQHILNKADVIYTCRADLAELAKYARNSYLAVRLSYFNEMKQITDAMGIEYKDLKHLIGLDQRIGRHYNEVKTGEEGWGKSCLPKDINALRGVAKTLGIDPKMLTAAWEKNLEVIPEHKKDWEKMLGRAVIKK